MSRSLDYLASLVLVEAKATLRRGFTSVRDISGQVLGAKKAIDEGHFVGPRIWSCCAGLGMTSGHADMKTNHTRPRQLGGPEWTDVEYMGMSIIADGVPEVVSAARLQLRKGAHFLKMYTSGAVSGMYDPLDISEYSFEELKAAADEAKSWNTYLAVHSYNDAGTQRSLEAGAMSIEHAAVITEETVKVIKEKGAFLSTQTGVYLGEPPADWNEDQKATAPLGVRNRRSTMRTPSRAPWFSIVRLCVLLVVIATLLGLRAGDVSAQVLPRDANPYGKSYGEWSVAYWKWAFSIPLSQSPWANDDTGAFAGVGQSGPVWFLGGSLGNTVDRTFTMPSGKAIFMPVHQWIFGASVFDCEPTVPGVTCDVTTLQAAAATAVAAAYIVEVTIDGEPVVNAGDYRALSPGGFSLTMPADNLPGLPAGTYSPQVSDGYWLMLAPLHVGEHTIQVHVASTLVGGFE